MLQRERRKRRTEEKDSHLNDVHEIPQYSCRRIVVDIIRTRTISCGDRMCGGKRTQCLNRVTVDGGSWLAAGSQDISINAV